MFSENLKKYRKENRLTQKDLAEKLKVSDKTVNHWENNYSRPDIDTLKDIKRILDVSYEEFLED